MDAGMKKARELFRSVFKEGEWGGYVNYQCKHCPFSTVNIKMAEDHVDIHIHQTQEYVAPVNKKLPKVLEEAQVKAQAEEIKEELQKGKGSKGGEV